MSALNNNLPLVEGSYVLMCDVDRLDDRCYQTRAEAEEQMDSFDGDDGIWLGLVERINDQLEIIFVCGDQQ